MPIAYGKLTRASAQETAAEFIIDGTKYSFHAAHAWLAPEFVGEDVSLTYGDKEELKSDENIPYQAKFGPASLRFQLANGLRLQGDLSRTIDPVEVSGDAKFEQSQVEGD
ncbi:uncharacterized protein DNG_07546 [Cephalotrichum gorgonifer]|uniref:Uncharacterized protein n=1 Tax=Cephalotrichum gorgonifer TaxID=2041049 RepID=A0AAE8SXI2_9PEZI|nr:uncharacterized protein DNG_07546 [Cephalotrichum gorgonifer]